MPTAWLPACHSLCVSSLSSHHGNERSGRARPACWPDDSAGLRGSRASTHSLSEAAKQTARVADFAKTPGGTGSRGLGCPELMLSWEDALNCTEAGRQAAVRQRSCRNHNRSEAATKSPRYHFIRRFAQCRAAMCEVAGRAPAAVAIRVMDTLLLAQALNL